jgi:hypothetical protein
LTSRRGFARSGWSFFAVTVGASYALHASKGPVHRRFLLLRSALETIGNDLRDMIFAGGIL